MINDFLIGSDPEFGIVNTATGKPASGIGLLPGSKKTPHPIGNGCGVQPDNVTAELTIPPCSTKEEFINYILYGKQKINEILAPHGLQVLSRSSARYDEKDLDNDTARTFGCDPSFSIYLQDVSPRPTPEQIGNLRSTGTHIHIGAKRLLTFPEIERLVFAMDLFLGVPSIIIDGDTDRRKIYGNPGDFRFRHMLEKEPNFSIVEYRTLGGYFTDNEELIGWMWDQTHKAVQWFNENQEMPSKQDMTAIETIITTNNIDAAIEHCNKFNINIDQYVRVPVESFAIRN